ncbi:hypothetical protein CRUP_037490 [Coryphaenoides rupestris]|nr:hypothetical protein CRUP_037490 [Coryphaenoides rupestris]
MLAGHEGKNSHRLWIGPRVPGIYDDDETRRGGGGGGGGGDRRSHSARAQTGSGSWEAFSRRSYCVALKMAATALKELASLERFLGAKKPNKYSVQGENKVPVLQTTGGPVVGLLTVCGHLVTEAQRPELLGTSPEHRAVVQQWLEYRVTRVDCCSREDRRTVLKDLNVYLQDKVYLAGNRFTLADALMYYGLHPLWLHQAPRGRAVLTNEAPR